MWTTASAEVFTWRDADGKVHFSDTPPPGVDAKKIRAGTQPGATSASGAAGRSLAEQDMEFRKRQTEAEKAQTKTEQEKKDTEDSKRNCADAKRQLSALEAGQRMSRLNEAGEVIPLDDQMRAQEIEKTRNSVQSWCK
ncbi:MAG: DUF4124 domain-containing protein [Betaproteobacteria bacterium]|nr:DUF4124 domain-containing protein [Betaproteobacteria bacterium]